MVDSRQKGARAELQVRDILRENTGLGWERVPGSGALDERHGLKGDVYVPNEHNLWCVEVKHYAQDQLTSKVLTAKMPQLITWWDQTIRESKQVNKEPILMFKFDRSKWFVAVDFALLELDRAIYIDFDKRKLSVALLTDFLTLNVDWIK